jgi:hypothetical protein
VTYSAAGNRQIEKVAVSSSTGSPLETPRVVVGEIAKTQALYPDIDFDGTQFLVVWQSQTTDAVPVIDIQGAFVTTTTVGLPFTVENDSAAQRVPRVRWNTDAFIVVFEDDRNQGSTGTDIYARPVKPTGVVLPAFVVANSAVNEQGPSIALRSGLLTEVSYTRRSGSGFESGVFGQSLNGNALSGASFTISDSAGTRELSSDIACSGSLTCTDAYQWYQTDNTTYGTDRIMARVLSY